MKAYNDKKIQEMLDQNLEGSNKLSEKDIEAYHSLYDILASQSDDFAIGEDFADHIIFKIEKKNNQKSLFILIGAISLLAVTLTGVLFALFYFYPGISTGFEVVIEFKTTLIFIVVLILAIQLLDWFFIKKKNITF